MENLGKKFNSSWLFRGLSFSLQLGDVLGVLGPNGSGKSTLLKIIAGLQPMTEGRIQFQAPYSYAELGYAALDLNLYPYLSAKEHLEFVQSFYSKSALSDFEKTLNQVGLDIHDEKPIGKYSTGMRQRLKLALSIINNPKILLLDEPSAPLDQSGINVVQNIISDQQQRGVTLIATNNNFESQLFTHQLDFSK